MLNALRDRIRGVAESPRAPWLVLLSTLVVVLPSLQLGFFSDDYVLRAMLDGKLPGAPPAWDLYRFATGDPKANSIDVDVGGLPWWAAPELRLHFIRPLSSLLLALDNRVFGDLALGYHAHVIVWYLAWVACAGWFFRTVLPRATGNLAMLVYALSAAHFYPFAWVSCRHLLLAALPPLLGFIGLIRRSPGAPWLFAIGLAVGLAAGENALPVFALAVTRAVFESAVPVRERVRSLAPSFAVAFVYAVVYRLLGGGAAASDGYVDVLSSPGAYFARLSTGLPMLVGNALVGVPIELSLLAPKAPLVAIGIAATGLLFHFARRAAPAMDGSERAALPWLVVGALLAMLPGISAFPGARVLLVPNLGAAALLAVVFRRGFTLLSWPGRIGFCFLLLVHLGLSPLSNVLNSFDHARMARDTERIAQQAEIGTDATSIFLIGASDPMVTLYVPFIFAHTAHARATCWSTMSGAKVDQRLTRTAPNELVVSTVSGTLLLEPFETLFRARQIPFRVGDEVRQCGATYRVVSVREGHPNAVRVAFDRPLGDGSVRILVWRDGRLAALSPPKPGEATEIPWSPGPLGVF